jgi:molecular chaperone GrpE
MAGDQTAGAVDDDGVGDEFDPDVERADEVEDYTGGIPRPVSEPTSDDAQGTAGAGGAGQLFVDVEALAAERDQLKELAVRLQADFENFRKRTNAQLVADVDRATGRLAEALLPVLDAAEAAYVQHPDEIGPLLNVMLGELRKHGLETLDLDGQPFDPGVAEAVAHEAGDGGDVVVADVLRSGYRWRGRTLRPAMVRTKD